MTTQRIAAIATLSVGIAIGIALDRSGRRIVPSLIANETTAVLTGHQSTERAVWHPSP